MPKFVFEITEQEWQRFSDLMNQSQQVSAWASIEDENKKTPRDGAMME